jgi:endothelin-converting enzyme/putative endopeptidase
MLQQIDAIKSPQDLQRMLTRLHEIGVFVPFGVYGAPDNHNPGQVIAYVFANGLGLPDRDYYLKPEQRFKDARAKYREHLAKIFVLAGYPEAQAKVASNTVFSIEAQLAKASLDNVALRDPHATDHKTRFADLKANTPSLDWVSYFRRAELPQADLNVDQPEFMKEVEHQLSNTPLNDWKVYLKWHLLISAAPSLSQSFVEEDFAFKHKYLEGRQEMKPRWKRCVESTDNLLGEALGRKYVERYFPPAAKGRAQEMVRNILLAMKDTIVGLDWMGPETKRKALEKLSSFNP